jgi:hypothetical protein
MGYMNMDDLGRGERQRLARNEGVRLPDGRVYKRGVMISATDAANAQATKAYNAAMANGASPQEADSIGSQVGFDHIAGPVQQPRQGRAASAAAQPVAYAPAPASREERVASAIDNGTFDTLRTRFNDIQTRDGTGRAMDEMGNIISSPTSEAQPYEATSEDAARAARLNQAVRNGQVSFDHVRADAMTAQFGGARIMPSTPAQLADRPNFAIVSQGPDSRWRGENISGDINYFDNEQDALAFSSGRPTSTPRPSDPGVHVAQAPQVQAPTTVVGAAPVAQGPQSRPQVVQTPDGAQFLTPGTRPPINYPPEAVRQRDMAPVAMPVQTAQPGATRGPASFDGLDRGSSGVEPIEAGAPNDRAASIRQADYARVARRMDAADGNTLPPYMRPGYEPPPGARTYAEVEAEVKAESEQRAASRRSASEQIFARQAQADAEFKAARAAGISVQEWRRRRDASQFDYSPTEIVSATSREPGQGAPSYYGPELPPPPANVFDMPPPAEGVVTYANTGDRNNSNQGGGLGSGMGASNTSGRNQHSASEPAQKAQPQPTASPRLYTPTPSATPAQKRPSFDVPLPPPSPANVISEAGRNPTPSLYGRRDISVRL